MNWKLLLFLSIAAVMMTIIAFWLMGKMTDGRCMEKFGNKWKGKQLQQLQVCADEDGQMRVL